MIKSIFMYLNLLELAYNVLKLIIYRAGKIKKFFKKQIRKYINAKEFRYNMFYKNITKLNINKNLRKYFYYSKII